MRKLFRKLRQLFTRKELTQDERVQRNWKGWEYVGGVKRRKK